MENISVEAVKTWETQRADVLGDPRAVLTTATWPNETGCNVDNGGNIVRSATINQHYREDGAGTYGGSISLCHSLQTEAVALRFSPEHRDKRPVVWTIQHQGWCWNLHWSHKTAFSYFGMDCTVHTQPILSIHHRWPEELNSNRWRG